MCGICGFIDSCGAVCAREATIEKMTDTLRHRGPDDAGVFVHENTAIGMRRLAIIDVAGGHQPLSNEDKTVWCVLNGEIYNFPALRRETEAKGHVYATHTDTEVLVHMYEEYGVDMCTHLDGMFAFALYDVRCNTLVLARDRAGKKPLYYYNVPGSCVFGSEIKALLSHPAVRCTIDSVALQQYLLYGAVMAPRSIFSGIQTLPAAHYLVVENGIVGEPQKYWHYAAPEKPEHRSEKEWLAELDTTLLQAVEKRLIADVPLGVLLSGGIDSSLITAYMCRVRPPEEVHTFSITIDDPDYDESRWSQWAANHLGTVHQDFRFTPTEMLSLLDDVLGTLDEPFADSSVLPMYAVSRMTRTQATVALAGDAGDEVFGGYPKYIAQRWAQVCRHIPRRLRYYGIEYPLSILPASEGSVWRGQGKVASFFRSVDMSWAERNLLWVSPFTPDEVAALTGSACDASVWDPVTEAVAAYKGPRDVASKAMYLDYSTIMQNVFNVKVDRASMRASLEVREPFMDTAVRMLAGRMPREMKVRGATTKYILKKCAEKYFPRDFVYRKKWGFGAPVRKWLRGALRERCEEVLSPAHVRRVGLVDPDITARLVREHMTEECTHTAKVWALFCLHLWYASWGHGGATHRR